MKKIGIILLTCTVAACSYFQTKPSEHKAICAQLKNQIIMNGPRMNGALVNRRSITNQNPNLAPVNKSYEDEGC